jgi:hypothetical protein
MHNPDEVPVNWGKLLEAQLEKWRGGRSHSRGIAEYITNSDDSYRRLKKFSDQIIEVEVHSKRGRHIDKLIVRDFAEGMSYDDLEERFFLYFESASGREKGAPVTGKFGTGGKAYAIMNFKKCWITSVKNGLENRAWFEWDPKRQRIVRNYNKGGYRYKPVEKPSQTIVELHDSIKVTQELGELILGLEKLARIRHVLKNQKVTVKLVKRRAVDLLELKYSEPPNPLKTWSFEAPRELWDGEAKTPLLELRYFQRSLEKNSFIDVSDGISSVADLEVSRYDGRPFSKYFNGSLTLKKLLDSSAVKENRKGLEEGDDVTDAIEDFVKASVSKAVSEVEDEQRAKERDRRLTAASEKMQELSKFLRKCELNFRLELRELKKRSLKQRDEALDDDDEDSDIPVYRKPTADDPPELLIRGRWGHQISEDPGPPVDGNGTFTPDENGREFAVRIRARRNAAREPCKSREGLRVLISDDADIPEQDRPVFSEFDDPVSDRDMVTKGIVWINANHPRIIERRAKSENDPVFLEMVANYVFVVVAQHQVEKQYEAEPDEEKSDPMLLFRQKFFKLQRELLEDKEISYFESEASSSAVAEALSA